MTNLTKLVLTTPTREITIRHGVKQAIKYGAAEAGQQAIQRTLKFANPASLAADLAQIGFEIAETGKAVGKYGNIGTDAVAGTMISGTVKFAVGAFGGFLTWGVGEVTSDVMQWMLS